MKVPPKPRAEPDRVKARIVYVPFAGLENAPATDRSRKDAFALAQQCRKEAVDGADWDALRRKYHDPAGRIPDAFTVVRPPLQKKVGEFGAHELPPAIARLAFALDAGESEICEYDPKECPWGYYVVQRTE